MSKLFFLNEEGTFVTKLISLKSMGGKAGCKEAGGRYYI